MSKPFPYQRRKYNKHQNATTLRIQMHYEKLGLGLRDGWKPKRFYRLCKLVNCTPSELMALCCVFKTGQWQAWLNASGKLPVHVSLILTMIESFWKKSEQPIVPINLLNPIQHKHTE